MSPKKNIDLAEKNNGVTEKNNDVIVNSYLVAPLSMSEETGASGSRVARRSLTSPSPSES